MKESLIKLLKCIESCPVLAEKYLDESDYKFRFSIDDLDRLFEIIEKCGFLKKQIDSEKSVEQRVVSQKVQVDKEVVKKVEAKNLKEEVVKSENLEEDVW